MAYQECQDKHTGSEFIRWCHFLEWEDTDGFHREDYYFAQLTALLASLIEGLSSKSPKRIKIEDCLLDFKKAFKSARSKYTEEKVMDGQSYSQVSKSCWFALAGIDDQGKSLDKVSRTRRLPKKVKEPSRG